MSIHFFGNLLAAWVYSKQLYILNINSIVYIVYIYVCIDNNVIWRMIYIKASTAH